MKKRLIITGIITIFLLLTSTVLTLSINALNVNSVTVNKSQELTKLKNNLLDKEASIITIKVALYDSPIFKSPKLIKKALNDYNWSINNKNYCFKADLISDKEVFGIGENALNNDNYDLFIIGAESRQFLINQRLFFSHDREFLKLNVGKWVRNVRNFVANGGGYIGICGGTNIASQGMPVYPNRASIWDILSLRVEHLGIANVYVNNQQWEEWQFAWKIATGEDSDYLGVPLNISVNQDHAIYSDYQEDKRDILWFGGPGLFDANLDDEKLGEVIPLSYYLEEPTDLAPLHRWRLTLQGYKPFYDITTDLKGQYASIATVYNNSGRVVLFGPHPEYETFDGAFNEFKGIPKFGLHDRYVYNWIDVTPNPEDYNWWIIRRSAAWVAHVSDDAFPSIE